MLLACASQRFKLILHPKKNINKLKKGSINHQTTKSQTTVFLENPRAFISSKFEILHANYFPHKNEVRKGRQCSGARTIFASVWFARTSIPTALSDFVCDSLHAICTLFLILWSVSSSFRPYLHVIFVHSTMEFLEPFSNSNSVIDDGLQLCCLGFSQTLLMVKLMYLVN